MPEYAEQTSELAARLFRRLIASPGVIDTQRCFRAYARLTELITHAHPLLHDLLARYGIDDDSTLQNLPLVNDQPWMLNLNTHVAHNSSFSSTTNTINNSFFAGTNQFVSSVNTTSSTHTELLRETSQSEPLEKFRISRRRVADRRQGVPVDAAADVLNPVPKLERSSTPTMVHVEAQQFPLADSDDSKSEQEKSSPSSVPALTNLTLVRPSPAPSVIQREMVETEIETSRLVLKDTERIRDEKYFGTADTSGTQQQPAPQTVFATTDTSAATPPTLPLVNKQTNLTLLSEKIVSSTSEKQSPMVLPQMSRSVPEQDQYRNAVASGGSRNPDNSSVIDAQRQPDATALRAGPTISFEAKSSPIENWIEKPQFVFRKNTDSLRLRELVSDLSSSSPLAAVRKALDSLPVAQPSSSAPVMKPEIPGQTDEPPAGEEITTEGMLRRISKMLLIERERRGY